jgi:hypothetical protein
MNNGKENDANLFVSEVEMNNGEDNDENMEKKSDEDEEEKDETEEDDHRLFTLSVINSYGSSEVQKIKDDGKPIRFTSKNEIYCLILNYSTGWSNKNVPARPLGTRFIIAISCCEPSPQETN